jgi:hypothetical protein
MTFSFIDDFYEGFLSGNPEFEVHAFWPQSASDTTAQTDGQCAGESAGDPNREGPGIRSLAYQYNQDSHTWTGTVRLMSGSQVDAANAISNRMLFMVWEDDETRCAIRRSDYEVYGDQYAVKLTVPSGYQGVGTVSSGLFALDVVGQIISGLIPHNQDDFVGLMVESCELGENYSDANMSVRGPDGLTHGRAQLTRQ